MNGEAIIEAIHRLGMVIARETGDHLAEVWIGAKAYDNISQSLLSRTCAEIEDDPSKWQNGLIQLYIPTGDRVLVRRER